MSARSTFTVALIGNPNTGKSTLFTALAGVRQRVGNYPGVTVEKKLGTLRLDNADCQLIDLPGTYSLAPRSPDEMVTVDVLLGRQADVGHVDAVLSIVDASNLERNLYLVSQVLELGLPTVVALNMADVARSKGIKIDIRLLSERLGVPVVELEAHRQLGVPELKRALAAALSQRWQIAGRASPFPEAFQNEVLALQAALAAEGATNGDGPLPRYLVERLLLDTTGYLESAVSRHAASDGLNRQLQESRARLAAQGCAVPAI